MNIKEAKEEIKNAVSAYYSKNEFGEYEIPLVHQRPIILMGPPGIGKTAIMEQIAQELGVGLVSYSMTHHTRQSALGLPFIEKKNYGGKEYSVSEYTMSEIIASVYDLMEETGVKEGILFLDEINCVSETLAPSMLQFLQYKIFGRHRVPDGWIVVTAGNPPEYNNSVREFDMVTWDRLKRIDIEPDYDVWKEYSYNIGIHPSILTYLDSRKADFYKVETTVEGKSFVTARGWSDLSDMIRLYEKKNLPVTEKLVTQYLQNGKTAKDFSAYYELFCKYRADYGAEGILDGTAAPEIRKRAKNAPFDERLALLGLLLETSGKNARDIYLKDRTHTSLFEILKDIRQDLSEGADALSCVNTATDDCREDLLMRTNAGSLSSDNRYVLNSLIVSLTEYGRIIKEKSPLTGKEAFMLLKAEFDAATAELKNEAENCTKRFSNMFCFCEEVFGDGRELLILVTELTMNRYASAFINRYGCEEYFAHNKELMFYERQKEIINELEGLD